MATAKTETVRSVGIDIGTSTTQLVVSRLTVKNTAPGSLVPRMEITDKDVVYKSDIHFTPLKDDTRVDADRIFALVASEFEAAGVRPEDIDTGAVIITGETAKKENARLISDRVAAFAGEFVVATAGGKLESVIAGKGSGAADYSRQHCCTVANIDIGGGTANVGIFKNGGAVDACCINVGGRLLGIDPDSHRISWVSGPMRQILDDCAVSLAPGDRAGTEQVRAVCTRMARVILECLGMADATPLSRALLMTRPLEPGHRIDRIMISGGVADHVYGGGACTTLAEIARYGDTGPMLGREVARCFSAGPVPMLKPAETIRATVIGAGARTLDVSGSTICVADRMLPLKNVPVGVLALAGRDITPERTARAVAGTLDLFSESGGQTAGPQGARGPGHSREQDQPREQNLIALGVPDIGYPGFKTVQDLAQGILTGMEQTLCRTGPQHQDLPLVVVLEQDFGKVLGQSLRAMAPDARVICVDQLRVSEGDYIDIGRPIAGGTVVPVVIKSLVFETPQL